VQHELARLERLGLVVTRRHGRQKYYRANEKHPLYPDLKRIVYKTAGLGDALRQALDDVPGIRAAFIHGSLAKGGERATSDVDLMIVGAPDSDRLASALKKAEEGLGREISLVTMGSDEWRERLAKRDAFVVELTRSDKIFLVGDDGTLRSA
jgi:predicted nucleotidyltransferase